jgi:predicted nucleic-acid-binding Zn-ribbon protein|tara:strand:- start:523 stop:720 length:198 start_codon:yes stop_codon:yes gene_type:complete
MAKLKKARVRIHICPTCKGNGFVKVASIERNDYTVHQCWDCDSEGEFYETNHDDLIDDGSSHSLH